MRNKWMLRAVCLLAGCLIRVFTSGQLDANKTTPLRSSARENIFIENRNKTVRNGSNVNLTCSESIEWNDLIYVIWNISLQSKHCLISIAVSDMNYSTCNDGKQLMRTDKGGYVLYIPDFSKKDEGLYTCDVSFRAGGHIKKSYVSSWVPPDVSGWLEHNNGHTVAVCKAAGDKPVTSIDLKPPFISSFPPIESVRNDSGLYTVVRRFYLPQNVSHNDLTCVAGDGPELLKEAQISFNHPDESVTWPFIFLGVCGTCSMVSLLTGLYLMREKLTQLSLFKKVCCKSKSSTPPREEKLPQPRDLEEVEPYASYVQRVNSIYNSSAELFNA